MWVLDTEKEKKKNKLIAMAEELLELPERIEISYDFPGMRVPQDVHVIVKLLDRSIAVSNSMKIMLTDMMNLSEQFMISEGQAENGSRCIDLVFSIFEVEKYDPDKHATEEDLKEAGLL